MKLNYFILREIVDGQPLIETYEIQLSDIEGKYHPDEIKTRSRCCFLDIEIEDHTLKLSNNKEIQALSEILNISIDTLEEIITDQRPRLDDYIEWLLILFKSIATHPEDVTEKTEFQVGLKIYDNVVISLHLGAPLEINALFRRFSRNPLLLMHGGITFLTTSYLDALIDPSYIVLEGWRKTSDHLEQKILEKPEKELLDDLVGIRQSLFDAIKIFQANREVLTRMKSAKVPIFENDYIPPELDDHVRHLLDESDIMRAIISDLMNMYYSSENSKLNKTLARFTVATSLLLLPSLIAGIFGMNNIDFPKYISFGSAILIMLGSMGLLFLAFKIKKLI